MTTTVTLLAGGPAAVAAAAADAAAAAAQVKYLVKWQYVRLRCNACMQKGAVELGSGLRIKVTKATLHILNNFHV